MKSSKIISAAVFALLFNFCMPFKTSQDDPTTPQGIIRHLSMNNINNISNMNNINNISNLHLLTQSEDYNLRIRVNLPDRGNVTISGTSHACNGTCDFSFPRNASITLQAQPAATYSVVWGEDCYDFGKTNSGTILLDGNKTCTATFRQPGVLDDDQENNPHPLGNSGGIFTGLSPHTILPLRDGKIILASRESGNIISLTRLNNNGSIDTSFGNNGIAYIEIDTSLNIIPHSIGIHILQDGKILVSFVSNSSSTNLSLLQIYRLHPDGNIDTTFGTSGKIEETFEGYYEKHDYAIFRNGDIITALHINNPNNPNYSYTIRVFKYNSTGSRDTAFGNNGMVEIPVGTIASSISIHPDGYLLVAMSGYISSYDNNDIVLRKFFLDGNPDTNFGTNSYAYSNIQDQNDEPLKHLILPDGKILVAARKSQTASPPYELIFLRFHENGQRDTSFNSANIITANTIFNIFLAIQQDGKILITGTYMNYNISSNSITFLQRYRTDGTPDTDFIFHPHNLVSSYVYSIALQHDGKILLGGNFSFSGTTSTFFDLLRIWP